MDFELLKQGNYVEINCMNSEPYKRCIRGIVVEVTENSSTIITDVGTMIDIELSNILSVEEHEFKKLVKEKLDELRLYLEEKHELERKLELIQQNEKSVVENLTDAHFLSRFNIIGAKNRLDETISQELLNFNRNMYTYNIEFQPNYNNQIEVIIKVSTNIEHLSVEKPEVEKMIKAYAPKEASLIKKIFKVNEVQTVKQNAYNLQGSWYKVYSVYSLALDVEKSNFMKVRDKIRKALFELQK